jgi:uncharacterized membrane protein
MPKPLHKRIYNIFYLVMSGMYLAVGLFFLLIPAAELMLKKPTNCFFGCSVLIYGAFRLYRAILRFFN